MAGANLQYEFEEGSINRIIEERGNYFTAVRMVRWKPEADFKLDIRKYSSSEEGDTPLKGISFMTEEGPTELITALLEEGYGSTNEVANSIFMHREDIVERISKLQSGEITVDDGDIHEEFYDAKDMVLCFDNE